MSLRPTNGSGTEPMAASASTLPPATGAVCPANSYSQAGLALNSSAGEAVSPEQLKLRLAIETFEEAIVGGAGRAEEVFEDLDSKSSGTIPWRTIAALLKPVESARYAGKYPLDAQIDVGQFVAFVEEVAEFRQSNT